MKIIRHPKSLRRVINVIKMGANPIGLAEPFALQTPGCVNQTMVALDIMRRGAHRNQAITHGQ
ncbi:MAG: hypothetical protein GX124_09680 [Clostridiales bacterium]|nr:hypothetical protein [Clostridiales bacterium]